MVAYGLPSVVSTVAYVVLLPAQQVKEWYHYSETFLPKYLRGQTALIEENEALQQQLANQAGTQLSIQRLLFENMQLRSLLQTATATPRIAARVIAQPTRLSYDLLQIDQGSLAGVVVGAPVFVGLDSVIGVVVHVTPTYAFVDLVTSPGFTASAYVVGPNIFATLEGVGGGIARVRVPQGISLAIGNWVLLPSISGGIYGEIVHIESVPTLPEQFGYVAPATPLQGLYFVAVGQDVLPPKSSVVIAEEVKMRVRQYFRLTEIPELTDAIYATTSPSEQPTTSEQPVIP